MNSRPAPDGTCGHAFFDFQFAAARKVDQITQYRDLRIEFAAGNVVSARPEHRSISLENCARESIVVDSLAPRQPDNAVALPATSQHDVGRLKILLALSGGGFRATVFHLGVLRAFSDLGLSGDITAISSVSGGSITAAQVVLKWHEYISSSITRFDEIESPIRSIVQSGLRWRVMTRGLLGFLGRIRPGSSATDKLESIYAELYGNRTLSSLSMTGVPKLFIMATNLSCHTAHTFFSDDGYTVAESGGRSKTHPVPVTIAKSVAASSAFPLLFPPLKLSLSQLGIPAMQAGAETHYLSDGGVFENLGLTVLRDHACSKGLRVGNDAIVVVSNAGRAIDWDLRTDYSRSMWSNLLRVSEIGQYWAEHRLLKSLGEGEIEIGIGTAISNPAGQRRFPPESAQQSAAFIRTDFDEFTDHEYRFLFDHGYSTAQRVIEQSPLLSAMVRPRSTVDLYHPWASDLLRKVESDPENVRLRKSVRFFSLKQFPSVWRTFATLAFVLLVAYLLLPGFSHSINWAYTWIEQQRFVEAPENAITFGPPDVVLPSASTRYLPRISGLTSEARDAISASVQHWRTDVGQSMSRHVVVLEQESPFSADFRDLNRYLKFERANVRPCYGNMFVVKTSPTADEAGYREVVMPRSIDSFDVLGNVRIRWPKKGEAIILVLVVGPKDGKKPFSDQVVGSAVFTLGVSP